MNAPAGILPARREKNGRLKRPTMAERQEAERAKANIERIHAASQPHRKGKPDPLSPLLENAFGTFCVQHKIREEWHRAGEKYRKQALDYLASIEAKDVPGDNSSSGEMSPERAAEIKAAYLESQSAVAWHGMNRLTALNKLVRDNVSLPDTRASHIKDALGALAVHFGMVAAKR